ncbi:hypothetical protein QGP82_25615 [Leptothoe sp. LEGE 181152]|uniref:Uncharacterized protein n=1 Tax=Adonisia turfae CCMR0081 TaxID=2292702 RepID=A0A6M0RN74_9CYAN|nr:hypothetical protein [Adonisia turfae]MDV3352079.1 hypothetical protein [Leptothoe sp. LEGE 181152]NEZ57745.1 hypothetical protein [Adonisia turfae CCMR0081]
MDRESLLKFPRYAFYTVLVCGLLYILIPMDPPALQGSILKIVIQQLTLLIVIALFLERALEVYKLSYLSPEKERLAVQVEQMQLELQGLFAQAEASSKSVVIEATQLRLFNAEEKLRVYRTYMRQNLLRVAIIFGALISLVGVRSLENAFNFPVPESVLEIFRFYLFRVLDVILTAGLIAGGSEGIHNVIKKLGSLFPDVPQKIVEFVQAIKQDPV